MPRVPDLRQVPWNTLLQTPPVSTEKTGRVTGRWEAQITETVVPDAMVVLEPTNLLRISPGWRSEHPSR